MELKWKREDNGDYSCGEWRIRAGGSGFNPNTLVWVIRHEGQRVEERSTLARAKDHVRTLVLRAVARDKGNILRGAK